MARLSRVLDARRVRVRFSFLAAASPEAALRLFGSTCGLNFSAALAGEQWLLLQRLARMSVRGETRVTGQMRDRNSQASIMEAYLPRALVAPPKVVFAPPTTSSEACSLASGLLAASSAGLKLCLCAAFCIRIAASLPVQAVHLANILQLQTAARCRCISRPLPASASPAASACGPPRGAWRRQAPKCAR